jgi:non-specific serine/threonine protein kinase/serine/threonine-protein kinase
MMNSAREPRGFLATRPRIRSSAMTTDTARWRKIREVLETAMELSANERERFLDDACFGDATLRAQVEGLLRHDVSTHGPVPSAARWIDDLAGRVAIEPEDREAGRRIGAYVILREIGSGGMGKVYLAERDDQQYRKRVAIKLIKRGMDTDDILRRFKNERQILADLDHPNIARLLDGGATEDGLPYVVLEYVDGVRIDRWCDERRATIRERIELFLAVCSAVQYAHQNLVVHRDLKPSNMLVTAEGVPKLLDFGIAKVLGPIEAGRTAPHTLTSERRLTPAYGSPEQLRGESITTASDVFSLGVVLCELLTGETPFESRNRTAESASSERPERPSTILATSNRRVEIGAARRADALALRRTLAGDLDTIVLKAMHGEPTRRYASVDQLAEDLRRHLDGLPVLARPDSFAYRGAKFVKRNKLLVAAASTIFLALAIGFTTSTVLYFEAVNARAALEEKSLLAESRLHEAELAQAAEKEQRQLAERRFADVRKLATTFIFNVHSAIEELHGSLPARQLIMKTATEYLERLATEKRDDPELQLELAQAWLRIATIQSSHGTANFGQTDAALRSIQRAFAVAQDLVRTDPTSSSKCMVLVDAHLRLAEALMSLHRLHEARSACEEMISYVGRLHTDHPESLAYENQLFRAHFRLAAVLETLGDYDESLDHHRAAVVIAEKLASDWPGFDDMQARLGASLEQMGHIQERRKHFEESLRMEQRALEIFQRLVARDPADATKRREIGMCHSLMAQNYSSQGCIADASAESRRSLETMILLSHGDELNASSLEDTAVMLTRFARLQSVAGDHEDAIRHCHAALGYLDNLAQRNPDDMSVRQLLAGAYMCMAEALIRSGRQSDGLRACEDARNELEALAAVEPSDTSVLIDLHCCYASMGESHLLLADAGSSYSAERIDELRMARSFLERGIEGLHRLNPPGAVGEAGQTRIEEFEEELRRCDAALARVEAGAPDGSAPPRQREDK